MKEKITFILVFSFLFLGFRVAWAEVIINEFVSNPSSGSEWVELFSTDSQNLDGWFLIDLASPGTETQHQNSMKDLTGLTIPAGEVIVVEVSGLNNAGDSIGLYNTADFSDPDGAISRVTYGTDAKVKNYSIDLAAPEQGTSGALISNSWETNQNPTKGELNSDSSSSDEDNSTTKTTSEEKTKQSIIQNPTMKAKILANVSTFTGQPFGIQANVFGYSNEKIILGKAYWNFGDGGSLEQINNFEKFYHTYYYPGEYVLVLEYYSNNFSKIPDAISKMTVKVLPTTVTISKIGDAKDFFVELTNNATSEIDVSGWIIRANNKVFVLPRNTVIMSKKQITLSSKITGFTYGDQYILKLFSGTGELVFDYNNQFVPIKTNSPSKQIQNIKTINVPKENDISLDLNLRNENNNSGIDLAAASTLSETNENENSNFKNSYFFYFGFIVLLVVSGGIVYYVRRGENFSKVGGDFKIIDE